MIENGLRRRLQALNEEWLELARRGELERAWEVSDTAHALRETLDCSAWPRHQQFIWRGGSLARKRVLVRCYHGLGDTIQFSRFVPRIRLLASEVILWAQPTLVPLLRTLRGGADRVLPLHDGRPDVDYDVDVELSELMHVLRATEGDISCDSPYLHPEPGSVCTPRRKGEPLRVGLVWKAGEWDERRSIPCELLHRLTEVRGVEWLLFQRGPALGEWQHRFGHVPPMQGMLEEALEMRRLDLLISVDTCSAHLAGALGVAVWTLLPFDADWRWMRDRADTPWYPTMRLLRQRSGGDWSDVIDRVIAYLSVRIEARPSHQWAG
jgi:hypothetical protein